MIEHADLDMAADSIAGGGGEGSRQEGGGRKRRARAVLKGSRAGEGERRAMRTRWPRSEQGFRPGLWKLQPNLDQGETPKFSLRLLSSGSFGLKKNSQNSRISLV